MALLEIIEFPNPLLKKKSKPIKEINEEIKNLAKDMLETMYDAPGVGLAAPQVGVLLRLIVLDPSHDENERDSYIMVNPEIVEKSEDKVLCNEGCLSVPGYSYEVNRPEIIKVAYTDINTGKRVEIKANGTLARIIQHEVDHLDGVLFIDRISRLKRNMVTKKITKKLENPKKDDV